MQVRKDGKLTAKTFSDKDLRRLFDAVSISTAHAQHLSFISTPVAHQVDTGTERGDSGIKGDGEIELTEFVRVRYESQLLGIALN